jgi:chromosome segregation ATPase
MTRQKPIYQAMRLALASCAALALLCSVVGRQASAADDAATARAHEMLRRTQDALRQAQSDNAALNQAKADLEAKLKEATRQLDASRSGLTNAQGSLHSLQGQQTELQAKYQEASTQLATTTSRLIEITKSLAARDSELAQSQQKLDASTASNASCEEKNGMLYAYGQEVLDRYQHKGVWAAFRQKEPVLGLRRVEIENVVQEYRLKLADAKLKPATH